MQGHEEGHLDDLLDGSICDHPIAPTPASRTLQRGCQLMKLTASWRFALVALLSLVFGHSMVLHADQPALHVLIDQQLVPVAGTEAPWCSDAEFLRRVSLDLIGMPPTADQAREFIGDPAPDKRAQLVDRLLASPHYARQLASTLDLTLMERRPHTHVSADEWQAWLMTAVRENRPWNLLVQELLLADGDDPATRPAARFTLDRASEPHLMTRDIGRIFFGRDLQCAQCHDHPIVNDYMQTDYQGLLAFLTPAYAQVVKEADKEKTVVGEKAGTELTFSSVFVGVPHRTGARMPDAAAIDEPFLLPGEEYDVPPADNTKPVPKFSRRTKLAEQATSGSNAAFNQNIVNRLWAQMFGRGLVHPLDLHHSDNPATDPELLRSLAEQFVAMKFDIKAFLRELTLTRAYQRSFDAPADPLILADKAMQDVTAIESSLAALQAKAEQTAHAFASATEAWYAAEAAAMPVAAEVDAAKNHYAEAKKKLDEANAALAAANANLQTKQPVLAALQQAVTSVQAAAQAIPGDPEIAEAVAKLQAKSQLATTEVEALTKSVQDLTAAIPAPTEAFNNAMPPLQVALGKLIPLSDAVKAAEQRMLVARRVAANDAETVAALQRRQQTATRIAQLPVVQQEIATARQLVGTRQSDLAAAQNALTQFATTLEQVSQKFSAATAAHDLATSTLLAANAEHDKRVAQAKSIADASDAALKAKEAIADDPLLVEVAAKLQQRALLAQTQTGQSQQQIDAAAAAQNVAADALAAAKIEQDTALAQQGSLQQTHDAATAALTAANTDVTQKESEFDLSVASLTESWARDFTVSSLKPLTPEQLCWTVFRVTGVYQNYWNSEVAELDKTNPLNDEQKQDPAILAARQVDLEQRVYDKLKANVGSFVAVYGAAAGQPQGDFFSTADQALFAANGGSINSWIVPAGDNVTSRIVGQSDPKLAAEELYLAVLTRLPTEEETADVVSHLASRESDKATAAQELVWALLNSAELRFNH